VIAGAARPASPSAAHQNERVAAEPTTRRAFLRRGVILAGGLAGGSATVAACAGTPMASRAGPTLPSRAAPVVTTRTNPPRANFDAPASPSGLLRISNRPGSIAQGTVRAYELATGVTVDYSEDIADDEVWLQTNQTALAQRQDIGSDLDVLGDAVVYELISSGRLARLDQHNIPNRSHLRPELASPGFDRGRAHSLPWVAGMAGLAFDPALVGRPVAGVADLFDPQLKGRVTMLSDLRDGVGMVMLSQGNSPARATLATVTQAIDAVRVQRDAGQIGRFTGDDDFADLASGAMAIAQVRSGDVPGLRAANPALQFVVPDAGSTLFAQDMVVPRSGRNQVAAESWMNWIYERANYAALIAQVRATSVLSGIEDDLDRIDPTVAADPLVNPAPATMASLAVWAPLDAQQEQRYTTLYAEVTG
jgi:spermidine/putrescine transport system substrate-binding protein